MVICQFMFIGKKRESGSQSSNRTGTGGCSGQPKMTNPIPIDRPAVLKDDDIVLLSFLLLLLLITEVS